MARQERLRTHNGPASETPRRADELPPLAEAKLAAPRQRGEIVPRARIRRVLESGGTAELTLVAAPAGYGKTTAVRDWCAARQTALAWVTLDEGDNDPARLWTYVATAVNRVRDGLGRLALGRLDVDGASVERAVDELMNGIDVLGEELVIVLDELQAITDVECLASIDYALEHLPANTRLVLITRVDPALRLARLRARGGLAELRASELAFTADEAQALIVEQGGIDLDAEAIGVLCARTEGWPAALYLALLWLRSAEDPRRTVQEFGGDHRYVAEYLTEEVLAALDHDARLFLLRVSVLSVCTPELCDSVLARTDSATMLAELERSNLLVRRLERGDWFRIHSLFAEYARFQLASVEPGAEEDIHRRAAEWFRSRGRGVEAAEHAAATGDNDLVAEILVEYHLPLVRKGRSATLLQWVRTLPDECIVDHPELTTAAATAAVLVGHRALEQRRYLQLAKRARDKHPERFGPYVEAAAKMVLTISAEGGVGQAVLEGRRSVELAEADADDVLVGSLAAYSRALYFAGELDEARVVATRAIEHPQAEHRSTANALARSTLALVAVDRGQRSSARVHAERARAIVGKVGSSRSWLGANAAAALGAVLAAEGSLAEAERELASAEHFFRDEVATLHHAWMLMLLARVRCRRGHLDEADEALGSAHAETGELADIGRVAALAAEVERELELARGRAREGVLLEVPSEAELAVLRLLPSELSARQIGEQLFLSTNTVRSHTRVLYRKLGVKSRADAVARADTLGLLGPGELPMRS